MPDYHLSQLHDALQRLVQGGLSAKVSDHLQENAGKIALELRDTVLAEIPAFSASHNPAVLQLLGAHAQQHIQEIARLLKEARVDDFAFVSEHSIARANQHFPLEATLHAYRCGHKVFSHWIRDALVADARASGDAQLAVAAAADFTLAYTDTISTIASRAYVEQTRLMTEVAGDQRARLLDTLLNGYDESDGRVATVLRSAGYLDQRQSFCVVLSQPVDVSQMENAERARRLARALDDAVPTATARRLIDVRDNTVNIIFSAVRRTSGWTAPKKSLAARIAEHLQLVGPTVLIGVSGDALSTAQVPNAYQQALLSLQLASVDRRVMQFGTIDLRQLIVYLSADKLPGMLPDWATPFRLADESLDGALTSTLQAYADANMNALKAAARLQVHPNTVYMRFQKIRDLTGEDPKSYHGLSDLITVTEALRLI